MIDEEASERRHYAIISMIIMLLAGMAFLGVILGYRDCQSDKDRVLECIKAGQSARDCGNAIRDSRLGRNQE